MTVSSLPEPGRRRARRSGIGSSIAAVALLVIGFTLFIASSAVGGAIAGAVGGGLGAVLGYYGLSLLQRNRQYEAPSAESVLAADPRPPVVYLRPFGEDQRAAAPLASWKALPTRTEEEQLAHVMAEFGPFVAIGDPQDRLPDLGAARAYVTDDGWRSTVLEMLGRARLVLLRAGTTPGFLWELEMAVRWLPPERVVILVAQTRDQYEAFRAAARPLVPKPLPAYAPGKMRIGTLLGFIYFTSDWAPVFAPLKRESILRGTRRFILSASLKLSLQPIYEPLKVQWMRTPISWPRSAALLWPFAALPVILLSILFAESC